MIYRREDAAKAAAMEVGKKMVAAAITAPYSLSRFSFLHQ